MPFLQEVGSEILIVMLCINGFIGVGAVLLNPPYVTHGIAIKSPFDIVQNMTAVKTPNIVNFTGSNSGTLLGNTTTGVYNVTANNNPLNYITNNVFYVLAGIYIFAQFISGIFIWQTLLVFHFPLVFVALVSASVIYFLIIRNIVYIVFGR